MPDEQQNKGNNKKPWCENILIMLPLIVFLFSISTFIFKEIDCRNTEILNAYNDFENILQRMISLPKESFELTQKYHNELAALNELHTINELENALLLNQAGHLLNKIPHGFITSYEYIVVGTFYYYNQQYVESIDMFDKAISYRKPIQIIVRAMLMKSLALVNINYTKGNKYFNQTLKYIEKEGRLNNLSDRQMNSIYANCEMKWAGEALKLNKVEDAQNHLNLAKKYSYKIKNIYSSQDPFVAQIDYVQNLIDNR